MLFTANERRRKPRAGQPHSPLQLSCFDGAGEPHKLMARLLNVSSEGFGLMTRQPLTTGCLVTVAGEMVSGGSQVKIQGRARVAYCTLEAGGTYRVGLRLEELNSRPAPQAEQEHQRERQQDFQRPFDLEPEPESNFVDYYEVLQVSPNADLDTIHRVYRMLAQRHHPDNGDTGNEEAFKLLLKAYRVLSDMEHRAAYDLRHRAARGLRWKIFDQPSAADGVDGERHKRRGILSLLYTKRVNQPEQPGVTLIEFEELLGCPREHLECSIWYLREKGFLTRSDNGRHTITALGFDEAETSGIMRPPRKDRLLTTAHPRDPLRQTASAIEDVMADTMAPV